MIRKVFVPDGFKASDIPEFFQEEGLTYEAIDICNWPEEFPYKPLVRFAVAHCGDALLINYRVEEKGTAAVCDHDLGKVWEDSCVEFFISPNPEDGLYYNIESNCIGKLQLCCGGGRESRQPAPQSVLSAIDRHSSLGNEPFAEKCVGAWELSLIVPVGTFFNHNIESLDGAQFKGNLYKCGDKLSVPHFLSCAPIDTPSPDFHRPEFFIPISFE